MTEPTAMILHLVSGERVIGICRDNGLYWELKDVFVLQEMFMEFDDGSEDESIASQLSLTSFTAYSENDFVSIPKQFVMCAMVPNKFIVDIHNKEIKSLAEQMEELKEKNKPKILPSGSVTPFKKRH